MRGSSSSRSILSTVAVVTPARSASSAWGNARRVLRLVQSLGHEIVRTGPWTYLAPSRSASASPPRVPLVVPVT
jgi:hypothetical protein